MSVQVLQVQLQVADQPVGGAAGARQRKLIAGTGGSAFESNTNSSASYHNWASPDEMTVNVTTNPTTSAYQLNYALAAGTVPAGTVTSFVRVRLWTYSDADNSPYTLSVQPLVAASLMSTPQPTFGPGGVSTTAQENTFDLLVAPDGTVWTLAKVLGYRWGFSLAGTSGAPVTIYVGGVAKMLVELWGAQPPTTYTPITPPTSTAYTPITSTA